jgi:CRP-like cAMP-binding protein
MANDAAEVRSLLEKTIPFRFLSAACLDSLAASGELRSYPKGSVILCQGCVDDDGVFLLVSGSVESVDSTKARPFRINVIGAGNYFGERQAVFGTPRQYDVLALEEARCFVIPRERLHELLGVSRAFAQSLGQVLRQGQGIFAAFERFTQEVERDVGEGHIELRRLLPFYRALEPALHPGAADEDEIDFKALTYATRRLPENVTRTFVFLLTDDLPVMYAAPERLFASVPTEARHRFVFEMLPGKDMVLVRSGTSDLMDFVSCLCLFAVETHKIRYRLNHPDLVQAVADFVAADAANAAGASASVGASERKAKPADRLADEDAFLSRLPFTETERASLEKIWPGDTVRRLHEITFNRQAYSVDIRKQVHKYNARLSELWTQEVGDAARELLGQRPTDLPADYPVDIVSSNTHSVSNCLNPFFIQSSGEIFAWAEAKGLRGPGHAGQGWDNPHDELYALAREYLRAHPEAVEKMRSSERERGIVRLPETLTTGIQVQLVDVSRLGRDAVDPGLPLPEKPGRGLIVNIDYAFGEQAEDILRSLTMLFGRNIRSINVLGKAGALQGQRGDVLLPTAFIEQRGDAFGVLDPPEAGMSESLRARLPGRAVHSGPLLTVGGTLLQNRLMLNFYRAIWGCVGLEMEGVFYHWAVKEAQELGVLRKDARTRFLYYVSDLPMTPGENLSERMSPQEGIPPLYAITREVLSRIMGG